MARKAQSAGTPLKWLIFVAALALYPIVPFANELTICKFTTLFTRLSAAPLAIGNPTAKIVWVFIQNLWVHHLYNFIRNS